MTNLKHVWETNEMKPPIPTSDQLDLFHEHTRMTVKEELELLKSIEEYEKAQKANDVQIAGTHYKSKAIQPWDYICLLYTSPSPRDGLLSRMPSSA